MKHIYKWFYGLLYMYSIVFFANFILNFSNLYTTIVLSVTVVVYAIYTYFDKTHLEAKHIQELAMMGQEIKRINDKMGIESIRSKRIG